MKKSNKYLTDDLLSLTDEEVIAIAKKVGCSIISLKMQLAEATINSKEAQLDIKILKVTKRIEKLKRELSKLKEERESFKY